MGEAGGTRNDSLFVDQGTEEIVHHSYGEKLTGRSSIHETYGGCSWALRRL